MSIRWTLALREAGASKALIETWNALRVAISKHQKLLAENGIGKEVSERDRVRVNARRVGLEAPPFADETEATFSDILNHAFERRQHVHNGPHDSTSSSAKADATDR